jgi:hypothetical protein
MRRGFVVGGVIAGVILIVVGIGRLVLAFAALRPQLEDERRPQAERIP